MFIKASHEANMSKEVNFGKIACRSPHRQLRFQSTLPPFSLIFLERRAVNKSVKYDLPPCYQNISTVQTIWFIAIQRQETINQNFQLLWMVVVMLLVCVPKEKKILLPLIRIHIGMDLSGYIMFRFWKSNGAINKYFSLFFHT